MKMYGGEVNVQTHFLLTSALVGSEWSALRPSCCIPTEIINGTNWIGHWVSPRAGVDNMQSENS
jgi:hypothetical protein